MTSSSMSGACLRTAEGADVPLRGVSVSAEVLAGHAHARVRQTYANVGKKPIEAVYTFPLPSDATLTGFTMTCEGRTSVAEIKEREEAFAAYDDALVAGHGAALLDQERPNVFTASVGNLLPGETTVIEIAYVQKVQADEGTIRWSIPTLVAPRYMPGAAAGDRTAHGTEDPTDRVPDADRISPPIGVATYGLTLDLAFHVGAGVTVESPSHAVVVTRDGEGVTRVTFASRTVALDRDVVVTARGAGQEPFASSLSHKQAGEPGVVSLTVVPDLFASGQTHARQDVVFVVDVSGSMEGDSIEQARAALRLCTRHLREGDRFNAIAFNQEMAAFEPALVPFTQATLAKVDAWISGLVANGGTEMRAPLLEATRQAPSGIVVLLTDGQVGNEDEILAAVMAQRTETRFYAFGIGTNVSDALLRGLAQKSGGAVEMIHPGERIDDKVVAQFARATAARVTDVSLAFEGVDVGELAPAALPPLVDGEPWSVFGRYEVTGHGRAILRGKLRGETFALEVPVELGDRPLPTLAKLWARERIRDLEGVSISGRRADANKARIVKLAMEHGLACGYTSFVVVERRTGDRRANGVPETRVVPVNAPAGWNMYQAARARMSSAARFRSSSVAAPMRSMPMGVTRRPMAPQSTTPELRNIPAPARMAPVAVAGPGAGAPPQAAPSPPRMHGSSGEDGAIRSLSRSYPSPEPRVGGDPLVALLSLQLASGLWDGAGGVSEEESQVRATARALVILFGRGVTTAHPVYGGQVKKAVEALLPGAARVASQAPRVAELALAIAWLVATGRRTREEIGRLVETTPALGALAGRLDEGVLRADLDRLAAAEERA